MNIRMGINHKLQLSPTFYNSLQIFAEFKADIHHVFIRAWKDPMKTWHALPYLATKDVIFAVLESWLLEWRAPTGSAVETENSTVHRKKEETKLRMAQLAEKRRKEGAAAKAQAVCDAAKLAEQ